MDQAGDDELVGLTANIVSAYVSNNTIVVHDVPALVGSVY